VQLQIPIYTLLALLKEQEKLNLLALSEEQKELAFFALLEK